MTAAQIKNEIVELLHKYENISSHVDILRALGDAARLEEAQIHLCDRIRKDVYTLFGKDEEGNWLSEPGKRLLKNALVKKFYTAHTCATYFIDAEIQFGSSVISTTSGDHEKLSKKENVISTNETSEPVNIRFQYSELTVGAGSGTSSTGSFREKGVTVMEAPYKSINLIVSASRGAGGLDQTTVIDFQLLTAGCSPSDQQVSLRSVMQDSGNEADSDDEDCSNGSGSEGVDDNGSEEGEEISEDDGMSEESREDEQEEEQAGEEGQEDCADYYSSNVSIAGLGQLRDWLGFRSLDECMEESSSTTPSEEGERKRPRKEVGSEANLDSEDEMSTGSESSEGSPYERDPALGELLQFLLSLPYADEGLWGIADLILNEELGAEEDEECSDEDEGCSMPCCFLPADTAAAMKETSARCGQKRACNK